MTNKHTTRTLKMLRRLARPSTLLRVGWLAVALLHGWLIARRFFLGDGATLGDFVIGVLCAAGVAYASLKFWRVSTWFDAQPRRALVFALVLLFGHIAIKAPAEQFTYIDANQATATLLIVAVPVMAMTIVLFVAAMRRPASLVVERRRSCARRDTLNIELPISEIFLSPHLFRRPPPYA